MRFERQPGKRQRLTFKCGGRVIEYTGLQVKGEAKCLVLDIGELDMMIVVLQQLQRAVTDDVCMEPMHGTVYRVVGVKP